MVEFFSDWLLLGDLLWDERLSDELLSAELWSMASVFCAPSPAITTTDVTSAGLLRKAMPNPAASSSGKMKTQNTTSGSRLSSIMRAQSRCRYPDQRPLWRTERLGWPGFGVVGVGSGVFGVSGVVVSVAIYFSRR